MGQRLSFQQNVMSHSIVFSAYVPFIVIIKLQVETSQLCLQIWTDADIYAQAVTGSTNIHKNGFEQVYSQFFCPRFMDLLSPFLIGKNVIQQFHLNTVDTHLLGVANTSPIVVGQLSFMTHARHHSGVHWRDTLAYTVDTTLGEHLERWWHAESIVTCSGDVASIGEHVLVKIENVSHIFLLQSQYMNFFHIGNLIRIN